MILKFKNETFYLIGIKAVIFDFDGTLVETEYVWSKAKIKIAQEEAVNASSHSSDSTHETISSSIEPPLLLSGVNY